MVSEELLFRSLYILFLHNLILLIILLHDDISNIINPINNGNVFPYTIVFYYIPPYSILLHTHSIPTLM